MGTFVDCLLIIGLSTSIALAGMYAVRKRFSRERLERCHEVGGVMLAIIGTLYAILVGMIVVSSQGKVDDARRMAVTESNMLSNIYHLAKTFQQPARGNIREHIYNYAVVAVNQDWSRVQEGKEKEQTIPPYRGIWKEVSNYVPQRENESQCYATMLNNIEELSAARKYRMVASRGNLPSVLWCVLIAGGVMIVLFTYFFFVESIRAQALMTAFVAASLSMNICLIYIYQNPYRAELGAKEAGFGGSFSIDWFKEDWHAANPSATEKVLTPQEAK